MKHAPFVDKFFKKVKSRSLIKQAFKELLYIIVIFIVIIIFNIEIVYYIDVIIYKDVIITVMGNYYS